MAEVRLEVELAHPPERVWQALSDARLLAEWLMPTDLEPHEGAQFTLEPGTLDGFPGLVSGEVTELVAPHRLVMLWQGEQLHTRMAWELTGRDGGGCQLRVVQSGFIGAPATLRRRALRATYSELFGERLPHLLDQLALADAEQAEGVEQASWTRAAGSVAVPRQRQAPSGTGAAVVGAAVAEPAAQLAASAQAPAGPAVAARNAAPADPWPGGPTTSGAVVMPAARGPAPLASPAGPADADDADDADDAVASGVGSPEDQPERADHPPDLAEVTTAGQPRRRRAAVMLAPWRRRLAGLPGWGRALAIGAATAVLAVMVLAAVGPTPGTPRPGLDGQATGQDERRPAGPGMALQPDPGGTGAPGQPGASPGGPARVGPDPAGQAGGTPAPTGPGAVEPGTGPGRPESTWGPGEPELAATMTSTSVGLRLGLLNVGGIDVTVTVSNPGPGDAASWVVSVDVAGQSVSDVVGAEHRAEGSRAIFTPASGGITAGQSLEFSFRLTDPLLLGSASEPTDCTIDGRPCG